MLLEEDVCYDQCILLAKFFIIGDGNTKVQSQELPGVTGKFGLGVQSEAGQRLIELAL